MKTDTDETTRVTIIIRRESHPEWCDRLVDVQSGRARANIMRAHLTLPWAVNASVRTKKVENTPPNLITAPIDFSPVEVVSTPPVVV